jgi:hypothetical protein
MEKIEFKEGMSEQEYNLYAAQCLYLGETPKKRDKKSPRVLRLCCKSVDRNVIQYLKDGKEVRTHDGYVPDFFPGNHYGDYIDFDIDIDTGQILNWKRPTEAEINRDLNNE